MKCLHTYTIKPFPTFWSCVRCNKSWDRGGSAIEYQNVEIIRIMRGAFHDWVAKVEWHWMNEAYPRYQEEHYWRRYKTSQFFSCIYGEIPLIFRFDYTISKRIVKVLGL